ncbi:MAG: transcriptional regulator [Bacteroidetes bacterium]|jgi:DNA-binding transcriptional ArsR family regulator|nr:MAG: transcriptional regulator [Bacteroidota bacterium]TAE70600.1 MAG: transcriptional regulator [Bacteroidota bacterium]
MASSLNSFTVKNPEDKVSFKIDTSAAKKAALTLRALNHKLRQQIIKLIDDNKEMPVTQIYVKLRLEQSVASQHLAILRRANLVVTKRDGKFVHYALNYKRLNDLMVFVDQLNH